MKTKRFVLLCLSSLLLLNTACSEKVNNEYKSKTNEIYAENKIRLPQGCIYSSDYKSLEYLDYETMSILKYCPRANCTHSSAACLAQRFFGGENAPQYGAIPYNDYIYFFSSATEEQKDTNDDGRVDMFLYHSQIMRYDIKNDTIEVFAEFDNSDARIAAGAYLYEGSLYFVGQHPYVEYAELPGLETPENQYMEGILYKVNLNTGEVKQFDSIYTNDLQYASAWNDRSFRICGAVDNKLYLNYYYSKNYTEEPIGVLGYTNIWFTLDLETDEIELVREDAPYIECITDGYICYIQDNMATLEKGEEIWQFEVEEKFGFGIMLSVADDKVWHFSKSDSWYYDLRTNQKVDLSIFEGEEFMEISVSVIDVYEDNLICYYENYGEHVFEKVPLDSVVKE